MFKIDLKRIPQILLVVMALGTGILVLLSFLIDSAMLGMVRSVLVEWTVIVIAFAILLGVVNVLRVHGRRIQERKGILYSLVLVIAFLAVFVPGILAPASVPEGLKAWVGPNGRVFDFAFRYVQRPLQSTLFSLMAFFAFTAAWRAFRVRGAASFVMFIAAVLILLGTLRLSIGVDWSLFAATKDWIMEVPVTAGARGILLGVALGTVVAGVRLLLGVDRPYSGP
jgi:hypothetical protein